MSRKSFGAVGAGVVGLSGAIGAFCLGWSFLRQAGLSVPVMFAFGILIAAAPVLYIASRQHE